MRRSGPTVIFPHVPKRGGTSILEQLRASGCNLFLDYDAAPGFTPSFQSVCERRNAEFSQLDFSPFDVVFGHFPAERYVGDYDYVTIIRHPLDRALSQFNYWKFALSESNSVALARNPLIAEIKAGRVGFVEYVRRGGVIGLIQRYLGEDLRRYRLVGLHDDYPRFCRAFTGMFGIAISPDIKSRASTVRYEPTPRELRNARNLLAADIDWFERQSALIRQDVNIA